MGDLDAKTREEGTRTEALYGGSQGNVPGDGHMVTSLQMIA